MVVESAPGEIRTPDLPGRSRPLYPLNYGRISWVGLRGRDSNPRPGSYGPPALAAKLPRIVPYGVEGETRTRKAPGGQQALDLPRLPLRHFDISKLVPEGRFELPLARSHGLSVACLPIAALRHIVNMEWQEGLEPSASCMARRCSGLLSYYHIPGSGEWRVASGEWRVTSDE